MKLTAYATHALRSLHLAALEVPDHVEVGDVVQVQGLARPHIVKAVHALGRAGYLEILHGRGGGYRPARPAAGSVIDDGVRLTEGPVELVECFKPERNTCPLIGIRKLSRALQTAAGAFMAVLDELTLADIETSGGELSAWIAPIEEAIVAPKRRAL